jgi:ABC-type oligopeptide transport system substrate-binding subunit
VRLVPSAGPYYVTSYAPGQGVVLERNPNYHGNRPHRLSRIELDVGVPKDEAVRAIEAGEADYAVGGISLSKAPALERRYGPGSEAARKGKQQYFVNPQPALSYITLNTHRPLFGDVRMRRAANFAIDRRAISRLGNPFDPFPARPTDQYLPPGIPGFADAKIYPLGPNPARARRLAGNKRRKGVMYVSSDPQVDRIAQVIKGNMAAIGVDLDVKAFPVDEMFERLSTPGEPYDMAPIGWVADYPDPAQFLNILLTSGITATFDDPVYRRKLTAVSRLSGPARYLAYGKLDADLSRNAAPFVALSNSSVRDFFSARIGCQVLQPAYGFMDLAALCIRKTG